MEQLSELARLAKTLEKQTAVCKRCGICQAACPLFPHTGLERDIARGKIAVLEGVISEIVRDAPRVLKILDRCLLCGRCAEVCPTGVNTLKIFLDARILLQAYLGLSPWKKFIFRQIIARPQRFETTTALAARLQPLFLKKSGRAPEIRQPRTSAALLLSRRLLVPLAPVSFHRLDKQHRRQTAADRSSETTVLFYAGCLLDKMFPHVGEAAVKALEYHGARVLFLENEFCCGIPALAAGDKTAFRHLVLGNLHQLAKMDFDRLVTACATCAFTIKILWPLIMDKAGENKQKIARISGKTMDISEFIAPHCQPAPAGAQAPVVPVTYHDPCHLKTSLGVSRAPRILLKNAPGCRLVEMNGADACCGMGGSFGLTHYDLSRRIGQVKAEAIHQTGCRAVATACPACMIQLMGMLAEAGYTDIQVRHVIELYMAGKYVPSDRTGKPSLVICD